MTIERFKTGIFAEFSSDYVRLQPSYIEISDTGVAGSLNELIHGLGRVPRGVRIVNAVLSAGDSLSFYRLDTDDAWTDRRLGLRFSANNAHVLLEVF